MAKLIVIIGPQAVGKMTVGQELEKITSLKLMHNHETIDLPAKIFGYNRPQREKLTELFRKSIFEEVAKSDLEGIIFTGVMDFNSDEDKKWIDNYKQIFIKENGKFYFVELETTLEERLKRNISEHRLECKPSKRNIEFSQNELLETINNGARLNSFENEINEENYIKIDNTNLSAKEVALIIKDRFNLK